MSLWRHRDFVLLWSGQSVSELGSAVTLVALPLCALVLLRASTFQVGQVFTVALATGFLTVFFDVAYQSYVPGLIGREQLADGNGKLAATQSFAQVAGPRLGGALYGVLRAGALTADAVSYAVSAAALLAITMPKG